MQVNLNTTTNKIIPLNWTCNKQHVQSFLQQNNSSVISTSNEIYFRSQIKPATIGATGIRKILSETEYDHILDKLKHNDTWNKLWSSEFFNKFEQGLMPYIGKEDKSAMINSFLRNRTDSNSILTDYIRVMDYALKEIDKTYGKYEGWVFRYGFFEPLSRNYVSTARDPRGTALVIDDSRHINFEPFYIIYTKNGHKIENVQKKLNYNPVYSEETEILIDPNTKFEQITEVTPQMEELSEKLRTSIKSELQRHVPNYKPVFYKEC